MACTRCTPGLALDAWEVQAVASWEEKLGGRGGKADEECATWLPALSELNSVPFMSF